MREYLWSLDVVRGYDVDDCCAWGQCWWSACLSKSVGMVFVGYGCVSACCVCLVRMREGDESEDLPFIPNVRLSAFREIEEAKYWLRATMVLVIG